MAAEENGEERTRMSPRRYRMDQRQEATAQTRAQILAAARTLLGAPEGISAFTIDAVARQAGVARMTVYYQFGSKVGLLEAISDDFAARGQMDRLATAFQQPDPLEALDRYIATFASFWETDRLSMRRLRALAALDPDFETVIRARDERRRTGARVLVGRLLTQPGLADQGAIDELVNMLFTLTSFEFFDTLAGPDRTLEDVAPQVQRLARAGPLHAGT
jgi:AcrR family transcriptional regulator